MLKLILKRDNIIMFILAIYIAIGAPAPQQLNAFMDLWIGKLVGILAISWLYAYVTTNYVMLILLAWILVMWSSVSIGGILQSDGNSELSEEQRLTNIRLMNQFPYSLEQEVIAKMAPLIRDSGLSLSSANYKPIIDPIYNVASAN